MTDVETHVVPAEIQALARRVLDARPLPTHEQGARVGNVHSIAVDGSENRLILVLAVDEKKDLVQFTLVHPYCEMAIDRDVIVPVESGSLGFEAVVEGDLRGTTHALNLGRTVGSIPTEVIDLCFSRSIDLPDDSVLATGSPLIGPLDIRWDFKAAEGNIIRRLSVLDDERVDGGWTIKFPEVCDAVLEANAESALIVRGLFELWIADADSFAIEIETIRSYGNTELLDVSLWRKALAENAEFFVNGVLIPMIDSSRSGLSLNEAIRSLGPSQLKEFAAA